MPESGPYTRLVVILIRPSKYDDEGYVIPHFRGTLPSNTLSCLNSLTETVTIARTNAQRTARVGRNVRFSSSRSPAIVSTRNASHQNTTRKIGAPPSHCTLA